jgi:prepilin signal peptidase PulO-like enzyme (type II secretory pathway)
MPKTPWTSIILDFVIKLLLSQDLIIGIKYNFILVVIDRLIKYIYIILYLEASIAENLAYMFLRIVVTNYNILEKIISNRNKLFILRF